MGPPCRDARLDLPDDDQMVGHLRPALAVAGGVAKGLDVIGEAAHWW